MLRCGGCQLYFFTKEGVDNHLCLPEAREMMLKNRRKARNKISKTDLSKWRELTKQWKIRDSKA